jgi:hypothetical protein
MPVCNAAEKLFDGKRCKIWPVGTSDTLHSRCHACCSSIDEFQELFVEDDKLASQASLILDRIVRQGRSFGVHAILSSQTLAGAYSLPRTTLGQMAVRIALQCDTSDAQLIFADDNPAAQRLKFPGQAIYNDAGGRVEGKSADASGVAHQAPANQLA